MAPFLLDGKFGRSKVGNLLLDEDASDIQFDTTRLEPELRMLKDFPIKMSDWRYLEAADICALYNTGLPAIAGDLRLLSIAIFTGTAQACMHGWYWAPSASCPGAVQVDCGHVLRPYSRLHTLEKVPPPLPLKSSSEGAVRITYAANCHPLDLGVRMMSRSGSRVAVVRYTSTRDSRNDPPTTSIGTQASFARYTHCREDQVFLRTTYWQAFERMKCDINTNVGDALDDGGLIYTPGVGILRGPLEEGALWYEDPPRVDIIWVALPARPQLAEQEQYANERDRNTMARTVDRIFAYAAANGVDILAMPPLGCGSHGCQHPSLDVADIIHRTAQRYVQYVPEVCIGSDQLPHIEPDGSIPNNTWLDGFADAVQNGRLPADTSSKFIVPISRPKIPGLRAGGKDFEALLEKNRKLAGRKKSCTPRRTFL